MALKVLRGDVVTPSNTVVWSITRCNIVTGVRLVACWDTATITETLSFLTGPTRLNLGGGDVTITGDGAYTLTTTAGKHVTAIVDVDALPGGSTSQSIVITRLDVDSTQVYSPYYLGDGNRGTFWRGSSSTKDYTVIVNNSTGASVDSLIVRRADLLDGWNLSIDTSASNGYTFSSVSGWTDEVDVDAATDCEPDRYKDYLAGVLSSPITHAYVRLNVWAAVGTSLSAPQSSGVFLGRQFVASGEPSEVSISFLGATNIWTSYSGQPYSWRPRDVREGWKVVYPRLSWTTDGDALETLVTGGRRMFLYDTDGTRTKPGSAVLRDVVLNDPDVQFVPRSSMEFDRVSCTLNFTEVV